MSVVVVATVKPIPEHRDEVADALKRLVATSHTEHGVECFALHADGEDFLIIEKWADQASVEAHIAAPPSEEIRDVVENKLREAPSHAYVTPIPAGDTHLGQI